jgi:hypothetical protein
MLKEILRSGIQSSAIRNQDASAYARIPYIFLLITDRWSPIPALATG